MLWFGGMGVISLVAQSQSPETVLKNNHSAVSELDRLAGRGGGGGVRRESASESINVVGAAALNKRPLDLRNLSGITTRHLAFRVEGAIRLIASGPAGTAGVELAVETRNARFESR